MSLTTEYGSGSVPFEALATPIEGVRIVGKIAIDNLRAFATPAEENSGFSLRLGETIPPNLEPIKDMLHLAWALHPDKNDAFSVFVYRLAFRAGDEDPFDGKSPLDSSRNGLAHKDLFRIIIASDIHPTVFYPTGDDGQPEMDKAWQANPGQIVEFDKSVWHSPEYDITDTGVRSIVLISVPNE